MTKKKSGSDKTGADDQFRQDGPGGHEANRTRLQNILDETKKDNGRARD